MKTTPNSFILQILDSIIIYLSLSMSLYVHTTGVCIYESNWTNTHIYEIIGYGTKFFKVYPY